MHKPDETTIQVNNKWIVIVSGLTLHFLAQWSNTGVTSFLEILQFFWLKYTFKNNTKYK